MHRNIIMPVKQQKQTKNKIIILSHFTDCTENIRKYKDQQYRFYVILQFSIKGQIKKVAFTVYT